MSNKQNRGFRLDLGEPWAGDLADFCAANYNAPQTEVIREALAEHIRLRLQEPVLKKRFGEADARAAIEHFLAITCDPLDGEHRASPASGASAENGADAPAL